MNDSKVDILEDQVSVLKNKVEGLTTLCSELCFLMQFANTDDAHYGMVLSDDDCRHIQILNEQFRMLNL